MKIKISQLPPNINKYIGRTNIWDYQKQKKDYHKLVKLETTGNNPLNQGSSQSHFNN